MVEESPLAVKKRWEASGRKDVKIFISKRIKEGAIRVNYDNTAGEGFKRCARAHARTRGPSSHFAW